jgi:hypothetical protein
MFETALQTRLSSDGILSGYLSRYMDAPAIFSELAPDAVEAPYMVYRIDSMAADHPAVERFSIFIDYYARDISRANSRKAVDRIKNLLDQTVLTSDRCDSIRIFYYSGGPAPVDDPRDIHYNIQFEARAGRRSWAQQLT